MYFNGRWVPSDVMDAILLLWGLAAIVMLAALYWFCRGRKARGGSQTGAKGQRKRRGVRKRR